MGCLRTAETAVAEEVDVKGPAGCVTGIISCELLVAAVDPDIESVSGSVVGVVASVGAGARSWGARGCDADAAPEADRSDDGDGKDVELFLDGELIATGHSPQAVDLPGLQAQRPPLWSVLLNAESV